MLYEIYCDLFFILLFSVMSFFGGVILAGGFWGLDGVGRVGIGRVIVGEVGVGRVGVGLEGFILGIWLVCFDFVIFIGISGLVGGVNASLGFMGRGGGVFFREGLRLNFEVCLNDFCGMGGGFFMGGWFFLEGIGFIKKMEFLVEKFFIKLLFVVYCCVVWLCKGKFIECFFELVVLFILEELLKDWLLICFFWRIGLIGWVGIFVFFCLVILGFLLFLVLDSFFEIKSFKDFDVFILSNENVVFLFFVLRVVGFDNLLLE